MINDFDHPHDENRFGIRYNNHGRDGKGRFFYGGLDPGK